MYLIVGLGNPEEEYANTRHNMGFNVINKIAKQYEIEINRSKFKGLYGTGIIEGQKVVLLKPQTYMNLSGESIIEFKNFYKIDNSNVIIIYDDMDLDIGDIRIRKKGGPGTHNGMKSVVHYLSTDEFPRVRVGIGKPEKNVDLIQYVIGFIPENEKEMLEQGTTRAKQAVTEILKNGIESGMNKYNNTSNK